MYSPATSVRSCLIAVNIWLSACIQVSSVVSNIGTTSNGQKPPGGILPGDSQNNLPPVFYTGPYILDGESCKSGIAKSITQYGITWTFSEERPCGQFVNGDYWVLGPVKITDINPKTGDGGIDYSNGSMLNPVPSGGPGEGWVSRTDFEQAFPNGGAIFDALKNFGWGGNEENAARFFEQPVVGNIAKSKPLGYHPDSFLNSNFPTEKSRILKLLRPNSQGLYLNGYPYGSTKPDGGIATDDTPSYDSDKNISLHLPYIVAGDNSIYSTMNNPLYVGTCDLDANGNEVPNGPIDPVTGKGKWGCFKSNAEKTFFKETAVLTVLAAKPASGSFRPPYAGKTKLINANWTLDHLNFAVLKKLPIPIATNAADMNLLEEATRRPLLEMYYAALNSNWKASWADRYKDGYPRRAYGVEIAGISSGAGLMLNSNLSDDQKRKLAIHMVQWGLDLYGLLKNGMQYWPTGGHQNGRLLPFYIAAKMLNDPDMLAMVNANGAFQEISCHFFVDQKNVDIMQTVYSPPSKPFTTAMIGMPEWTGVGRYDPRNSSSWNEDKPTYVSTGYRYSNGGSNTGTVAALLIMGARKEINNEALFQYYIDRYYPNQRPGYNQSFSINSNDIQPLVRDMWDAYVTPSYPKTKSWPY